MRYLTIIFLFITTFVSAQQQMFLRSTPAAGVTGILDSYTGAAAAYATALLYSGYSGSCLRVRRDSDNAEQDIGFSGQGIDEAAINTFCSGANCFVKTWYDQSGNGNNATQSTAGNQPKIYDSSTGIIYENSIVALQFNGSTTIMQSPIFTLQSQPTTKIAVATYGSVTNWGYITDGSSVNRQAIGSNGSYVYRIFAGLPLGDYASNSITTNQSLVFGLINTTASELHLNSVGLGVVTTGSYALEQITIGGSSATLNSEMFLGSIQAVVAYASDQSANRTGIETAINNYFNIYP